MNKLLTPLSALIVACGACAVSGAGAATRTDVPASAAHAGAAASKPAPKARKITPVPTAAASANQAGVGPRAGGEQGKGPPKQMTKTEAQSNSAQ